MWNSFSQRIPKDWNFVRNEMYYNYFNIIVIIILIEAILSISAYILFMEGYYTRVLCVWFALVMMAVRREMCDCVNALCVLLLPETQATAGNSERRQFEAAWKTRTNTWQAYSLDKHPPRDGDILLRSGFVCRVGRCFFLNIGGSSFIIVHNAE